MKSEVRFFFDLKFFFTILATSFIFSVLFYLVGYGYSPDSNYYSLAAQLFSEGSFCRKAVYPPLFYCSLGILKLVGFGEASSYFMYHLVGFFVLAYLFFLRSKSSWVPFFLILTLVSCRPVLHGYGMIWTEFGYSIILAYLGYILTQKEKPIYKCLSLYVTLALLPIQRYIGGFLVVFVSGFILLESMRTCEKKIVFNTLCKLALASVPLVLTCVWNYVVSGYISGPRSQSPYSLSFNLDLLCSVLGQDFKVELLLFFVSVVLFFFSKSKRYYFVLVAIPFIQIFAQLYSSSTYWIDKINSRYFIVLCPFIYLSFITFYSDFVARLKFKPRIEIVIFFVFCAQSVASPALGHVSFFERSKYINVSKVLSYLPDDADVGVYYRGMGHAFLPSLVFTHAILPLNYPTEYTVRGDYERFCLFPVSARAPKYYPLTNSLFQKNAVEMKYDAVIIFKPRDKRSKTLKMIRHFKEKGLYVKYKDKNFIVLFSSGL